MAFQSFARARRQPRIMKAARDLGISAAELRAAIRAEADGTPTWAQWVPDGSSTGLRGDLNLQIDGSLALAADFVPTE